MKVYVSVVLHHRSRRIYHITNSSELEITWKEVIDLGKKIAQTTMPYNWVVWYPRGAMTSSRLVHNVKIILFHYIPAIILDTIIVLTGNKPV